MSELKPKVFKLSGNEKYTRLMAGSPDTAGMKSGYMTLAPGENVGVHKTAGREEAIIVFEGTAAVFCEDKLFANAAAESVVYIPPETNHDIKNLSQQRLRYVYVVTPIR